MENSAPIGIMSKRPVKEITSIPELETHLTSREIPFVHALARLSYTENFGWEKIVPFPEYNRLVKSLLRPPQATDTALDRKFTGAGLCKCSTIALMEAMKTLAPSLRVELIRIQTDMDAEFKTQKDTTTKGEPDPHTVALVTDTQGNSSVIDTSFKQVEHDGPMITVTPMDQLASRYHVKRMQPKVYPEQVVTAHRTFIDTPSFDRLVSSLL